MGSEDDLLCIGTRQAEHQPFDGFAATALRDHAVTRDRAVAYGRHVGETDRAAVLARHDDGTKVVLCLDAAFAAHQ